jgi:shikimate kinase
MVGLNGRSGLTLLACRPPYRIANATITTRGESPAGAGIAGSSALAIALCAALARWTGASERRTT